MGAPRKFLKRASKSGVRLWNFLTRCKRWFFELGDNCLRSLQRWVRRKRPPSTWVELLTLFVTLATLIVAWLALVHRKPEISLESPLHSQLAQSSVNVRGRIIGDRWPLFGVRWDEWVVKVDGQEMARSSSPDIVLVLDTSTLNDGLHHLSVEVYEGGRLIKTETRPFEIDNTPPTIIVGGVPSDRLVAGVLVIDVKVQEGALEEIILDGTIPLATPILDTRRLADGWHSITFTGVDQAGNRRSETLSFMVDNSPPCIESLGVKEGAALSGRRTITPEIVEPHLGEITWFLNGNPYAKGYQLDLDTRDYEDGLYILRLEAVDVKGHSSAKEITVMFDNTPPILCIRAFRWPVFASVDRSYIRVSGVCSEAAVLTYEVDGQAVVGPEIPLQEFSDRPRVEVRVTATDQAGNSDIKTSQVRLHPSLFDYVSESLSWILGEDRRAGIAFLRPHPPVFNESTGIFGELVFPGAGGVGFRFPWYTAELRGYIRPVGLGMAIPLSHLLGTGDAPYRDRGASGTRSSSWIEVGLVGLWPSDVTQGSEEENTTVSVNWIGVGARTLLEFADLLGGGKRDMLALTIDAGLRVMLIRRGLDKTTEARQSETTTGFGFVLGIGVEWYSPSSFCSRALY